MKADDITSIVDPQVISEWLKKADEDFDFGVSVLDDSTFYDEIKRLLDL
ncbi:MAG: hypothetical protein JW883_02495 [Deltaproteobacteria bacterium]|nr:hypothetical protein [Deltaproteobacteria bacterium]